MRSRSRRKKWVKQKAGINVIYSGHRTLELAGLAGSRERG